MSSYYPIYALGFPHSLQNFPVFTMPQAQVQGPLATGFGPPHSEQNFPAFTVPQAQVQDPEAFAFCGAGALGMGTPGTGC